MSRQKTNERWRFFFPTELKIAASGFAKVSLFQFFGLRFSADLHEHDETEVWPELITLIEMHQVCFHPLLLREVTDKKFTHHNF